MPGAVRQSDWCSGHSCFPSRQNTSWSSDVFINSLGAHRVGDSWAVHCCPDGPCHDGTASSGSPNVFTNGKAQCRIGDNISCGSTMATGSSNVIIN